MNEERTDRADDGSLVWSAPWYAAADTARNDALKGDVNDQMSALAVAVDAAIAAYRAAVVPPHAVPDPTAHATGWAARLIDGAWCVGMDGNLDTVHDATIRVTGGWLTEDAAESVARWIANAYNRTMIEHADRHIAMPAISDREKMARIVDPRAWELHDVHLESANRADWRTNHPYEHVAASICEAGRRIASEAVGPSLAKIDAIMGLLLKVQDAPNDGDEDRDRSTGEGQA